MQKNFVEQKVSPPPSIFLPHKMLLPASWNNENLRDDKHEKCHVPLPVQFFPEQKRNFNFCGCCVFLSEKVPRNFFLWKKVLMEQRISRSSQFCRRPPLEQYVHSQFDFPIYEGDFFHHPDFCPFLWTDFCLLNSRKRSWADRTNFADQRDSSHKRGLFRLIRQLNDLLLTRPPHSTFEYAPNFYYCSADQLENLLSLVSIFKYRGP